jgi:hypothetical protein
MLFMDDRSPPDERFEVPARRPGETAIKKGHIGGTMKSIINANGFAFSVKCATLESENPSCFRERDSLDMNLLDLGSSRDDALPARSKARSASCSTHFTWHALIPI